jgi:hypothetical protein
MIQGMGHLSSVYCSNHESVEEDASCNKGKNNSNKILELHPAPPPTQSGKPACGGARSTPRRRRRGNPPPASGKPEAPHVRRRKMDDASSSLVNVMSEGERDTFIQARPPTNMGMGNL